MICSRCRRDLDPTAFSLRSDRPKGRQSYCRACIAAYAKRRNHERRCCYGLRSKRRCGAVVAWKCPLGGAWRACDKHRLPGDEPVIYPAYALHAAAQNPPPSPGE